MPIHNVKLVALAKYFCYNTVSASYSYMWCYCTVIELIIPSCSWLPLAMGWVPLAMGWVHTGVLGKQLFCKCEIGSVVNQYTIAVKDYCVTY